MSQRPEFHLARIYEDGSSSEREVYQWHNLPWDFFTNRRAFAKGGIAVSTAIAWLSRGRTVRAADDMPENGASNPAYYSAHKDRAIRHLFLSPDDKWLVSADDGGTFKIWSLETGLLKSFDFSRSPRVMLGMSPDGRFLVTGTQNYDFQTWSLPDRKLLSSRRAPSTVTCCAFSPDGNWLLFGTSDPKPCISIWPLPDGKESIKAVVESDKPIDTIGVSTDGKWMWARLNDNSYCTWSFPDGVLHTHKLFSRGVKACDWPTVPTSTGVTILSVPGLTPLFQQQKLLVDVVTQQTKQIEDSVLRGIPEPGVSLAGHPYGMFRVLLDNNTLLQTSDDLPSDPPFFDQFPTPRLSSSETFAHILEGATKTTMWKLPDFDGEKTVRSTYKTIAVSTNGKLLAIMGGAPGRKRNDPLIPTLKVYSLPDATQLAEIEIGARRAATCLAFTNDGKYLLSGTINGSIEVFEIADKSLLTFLFDPNSNQGNASVITFRNRGAAAWPFETRACGDVKLKEEVCVCNCVRGRYVEPRFPNVLGGRLPWAGGTGFGGSLCTCNKICTCIPVCQAHRLADENPVVARLAEALIAAMGPDAVPYLRWAERQGPGAGCERIVALRRRLQAGESVESPPWPSARICRRLLDHGDEVVAVMAAQMLELRRTKFGEALSPATSAGVESLLAAARRRAWHLN